MLLAATLRARLRVYAQSRLPLAVRAASASRAAVASACVPRGSDDAAPPPPRARTLMQRVVAAAPVSWQPYLHLVRLDKPIGSLLLMWPCMWSIELGTPAGVLPDARLLALFAAGSWLMRGAGCIINDLWDRDFDRRVERTRSRPLAAGTVGTRAAFVWLGAHLTASLGILLSLNMYSIALGFASTGLVVVYPLMKRITFWPQAVLGLTFNWGALMGYSAVAGHCDWSVCLPLYAGGLCWTLVYDTIYAHQDKADDVLVGVKSTALLFGERSRAILSAFGASAVACIGAAGYAAELAWPFYAGLGAAGAQLAWQLATVDWNSPADCMRKFVSNQWFGAIVAASVLAGKLVT